MNRTDAKIYLIGPTSLARTAYRRLFETDLECSIDLESGFEATSIWAALRHRLDLVVIDCDTPTTEIVDAVQMIPRLQPRTKLLVLAGNIVEADLVPWRRCPVDGIVSKQCDAAELQRAMNALLKGERHLSDAVRKTLSSTNTHGPRQTLSRRESELLPLLAAGCKLQDAADQMQISYKTADSYRTSLLRKLGLRDRVGLARYAIREKIISP